MKYLKVMLPMLAFVLAIGMSFAFTSAEEIVVQGFYEVSPGNRLPIDIDCKAGTSECSVQFIDENGIPVSPVYLVYPDQTNETPLPSLSNEPIKIEQ